MARALLAGVLDLSLRVSMYFSVKPRSVGYTDHYTDTFVRAQGVHGHFADFFCKNF